LRAIYLEKTGNDLDGPRDNTRAEKRKSYEQASFDLLFDPEQLKDEVRRFFKEIGKDEVEWNDVWSFYTGYERDADSYFPKSAVDVVMELTRNQRTTDLGETEQYMDRADIFEFDRIETVYNTLKNYHQVTLSSTQLSIIEEWVNRMAQQRDFRKAISLEGHGGFIDNVVLMICYFIKTLHIKIPDEKMLDLTEFYDFGVADNSDWFGPIESQTSVKAVAERVTTNLQTGGHHDKVWAANAEYALSHHLEETYEFIRNDLITRGDVLTIKAGIARLYIEYTSDSKGLMDVLSKQGKNSFRWDLADMLKDDALHRDLETYFISVMYDETEEQSERLQAAKRLTAMNIKAGFDFYADYILAQPKLRDRYDFWFRFLNNLTSLEHLPRLIALLDYSLRPENTADAFNRIDGQVTDALFNLAIHSLENLQTVKATLEQEIAAHNPDWNFLFYLIDRMEFQYHLNQSQAVNFDSAVVTIDALGL